MRNTEAGSDWRVGLSLIQVIVLLCFAALLLYVTDNGDVSGGEPRQNSTDANASDASLRASLDAATQRTQELEGTLGATTFLIEELALMTGANTPTKEGFQEAIDSLKRGYALCQKDDNILVEATIQHGAETLHVIGDVPSDLALSLGKGDHTSDLEQIVSFIQDVYEYEKDHKCRFNYRLKYATDNDYRKGRDGYEKYFYPEKLLRTG